MQRVTIDGPLLEDHSQKTDQGFCQAISSQAHYSQPPPTNGMNQTPSVLLMSSFL